MSDNVILLGAGASYNAGIPLMSNFIDTMWNIARTGRCNGKQLSDSDRKVLENALGVREDLDGYHGRASFDMWNIEDLLSILSFNALAGGRKEKSRLEAVTKGIAKTIELTCGVTHNGKLDSDPKEERVPLYENFWVSLLNFALKNKSMVPPIITFNYDLVLERSLLRVLTGSTYFNSDLNRLPWKRLVIKYGAGSFTEAEFGINIVQWEKWGEKDRIPVQTWGPRLIEDQDLDEVDPSETLEIPIYKLHGSVNFPRPQRGRPAKQKTAHKLITALDDPLILPPVFNKATASLGGTTWADALNAVRSCKNLIICGYSLPATDIYMQYFLKAALGPNQDLNKLFVFDPVLFRSDKGDEAKALKRRYSSNFSESIQHRISFEPIKSQEGKGGTFEHLVFLLARYPLEILFG
ncbi:MAG: hypothetical protein EAZ81_08885 [Verrucomicrobia bacterium]|nr:MAG: hypothetical protein EAZ81_08885 [Verrucomicrobiota bacterium]